MHSSCKGNGVCWGEGAVASVASTAAIGCSSARFKWIHMSTLFSLFSFQTSTPVSTQQVNRTLQHQRQTPCPTRMHHQTDDWSDNRAD